MKDRPSRLRARPLAVLGALAVMLASSVQAQVAPVPILPPPGQLVNVSIRTKLEVNQTIVLGFVVSGTAPARILMRGIGPGLARFGVTDAMAHPRLMLTAPSSSGSINLYNTNWQTPPSFLSLTDTVRQVRIEGQTSGFPLLPSDRDAAILADLSPGAYTITVSADVAGEAGTVLAEVYNVNYTVRPNETRLTNLSALGYYSETSPLLAGFVVYGSGGNRYLLRSIGPGLRAFGVPNAISDSNLELLFLNDSGSTNPTFGIIDDWDATPGNAFRIRQDSLLVGAFPLTPNSRDAALSTGMMINTPQNGYLQRCILRGGGPPGASGMMLLEIYEVRPEPTDY
ncbi:MAG: hypothetical protein NTV51_24270 [Verrucomicrobia bacterium]|nr:hypothetical protein [Verrucomicrobiota bacterium]